jgi:hypothetical protein
MNKLVTPIAGHVAITLIILGLFLITIQPIPEGKEYFSPPKTAGMSILGVILSLVVFKDFIFFIALLNRRTREQVIKFGFLRHHKIR